MPADLALILPAFNEEVRLPAALQRLADFGRDQDLSIELVVVNDGSTDATAEIVRRWQSIPTPGVTISLVEIAHRGKGAAVRAGMHRVSSPIMGYCDVDLSAGPDALAMALQTMAAGGDMVIASRVAPGSVLAVRQPWYRERAGRAFNLVLRKLSRIPFKDTQCGLKLFRGEVAREIFRRQRLDGFAFDAELVVLAMRLGYRVQEIPVHWAHHDGSKLHLFKDSVSMSRDIARIVRRLGRGKVHTLGIPSPEAMEMMTASEDRHWWYQAKRRLISASLGDPIMNAQHGGQGETRCLDIGCGGGAMLAELAGNLPAFGVDLSSDALSHARKRGLSLLVSAEAGALPFVAGSFSVALALDVLEHHGSPEELLKEINRVLVPGGILMITVPAFQWMWSYADHVLGHYRRYTRGRLAEELRSCGLEPQRITYFHSWLLPAAWLFRKLRALTGRTDSADDFALPELLNRVLLKLSILEMWLLKTIDLPFGLSVLAIARAGASPASAPAPSRSEQAVLL